MPNRPTANPTEPAEVELLLACARVELDAERTARIRALAGGPIDWPRLVELATRHGLRPLLYRSLSAACAPGSPCVPPETLAELRAHYRTNSLRNLRLTRELLRVLSLLEAAGIPAIPLKGPALAEAVYGDLGLREAGDLDVLVRPEDALRAEEALGALGYRPRFDLAPVQKVALLRTDDEHPLVRRDGAFALDLQWGFAGERALAALGQGCLAAGGPRAPLAGQELRALADEDLLLLLCIHGAKHAWASLGWLVDVAEVIRSRPALAWPRVHQGARRLRAGRMLALGLTLAHELLGADLPPAAFEAAPRDRALAPLARWVRRGLAEDGPPGLTSGIRFQVRVRQGLHERAKYVCRLCFVPTGDDYLVARLPAACRPVYSLIRPFRLLAKYGLRQSPAGATPAPARCQRSSVLTFKRAKMGESLGVDIFEVRPVGNSHPDRHMHLPGAGVGGHCLPKDPWLLNQGVTLYGGKKVRSDLLAVARRINHSMPEHVAELVAEALERAGRELEGARVAVLGVAYLESSDDTRNTPSLPLVQALRARGALVTCHDPYVRRADFDALEWGAYTDGELRYTQALDEALAGADCAVLVTRHREYLDGELLKAAGTMRTRVIVDGRGCLDEKACAAAGLAYVGLGWGAA